MKGKDGGAAKVLRREWALRRLPRWGRGVRRRVAPLRTEMPLRDIPVFRMAYFTIKPYYGLISKTLMLQVRSAHPPMPHRNVFSKHPGVPLGLFSDSAPTHLRCAGVPLGLFGKPKRSSFSRFAASIKPYYALFSKTHMLQVHCANPTGTGEPKGNPSVRCGGQLPPSHRNAPSGRSGVAHGFFPKRAYYALFSKTHMLQVRCAHPAGTGEPKGCCEGGSGNNGKRERCRK